MLDTAPRGLPPCPVLNRRSLALCLLALLLVFAQHAAALHALGHAVGAPEAQQKHLPASQVCEKCAASGALEAGALPALPVIAGIATPSGHQQQPPAFVDRFRLPACHSRAPPLRSV